MIEIFNAKCPKCGSRNTFEIKEGFFKRLRRFMWHIMFIVTIIFMRAPQKQFGCRACGFTWH